MNFSNKFKIEDSLLCQKSSNYEKQNILEYVHNIIYDLITHLNEFKFPILNLKCKSEKKMMRCLNFSNPNQIKKLALFIKLLSIIYRLIQEDKSVTKRDLLYQFKHVFKNQVFLDNLINDLARTLNVSRDSFNIKATSKGLVAGIMEITMFDETKIIVDQIRNSITIPDDLDKIKDLKTNAKFVLIVEKDATLQRLLDDNFLMKYPALLITGKGEPDIITRRFANFLFKKFGSKIDFFCLTDANPFGILIWSIYKYGSQALIHEKELNLPCLEWIGLKLSDLDYFPLKKRNDYLLELNQYDKMIAKNLIIKLQKLNEYCLIDELEYMLEKDIKAELQYLQHIQTSFICDFYLRAKFDKYLTEYLNQNNLF